MKRVLITDDEKNIRLTISRALENLGNIEIETALNGEDAIQKLINSSFDLLLLDIKMPGMNGLDVIDIITEKNINVKIVVISAHGTIDTAVQAMKKGAVDFIEKPFTPDEIRSIVQKTLEI